MIGTQVISDALIAWAVEECPQILGTYSHPHAEKESPFPDIAAEIQQSRVLQNDEENFPRFSIEQILLRVHRFSLMFVVDPDNPEVATQQLETIIDTLTQAMISDDSLGGRVPSVSPLSDATYEPPFIEFADGTRGRLATLEILVADTIDEEDL